MYSHYLERISSTSSNQMLPVLTSGCADTSTHPDLQIGSSKMFLHRQGVNFDMHP